jgi:hypothetical protein
MEIDRLQSTCDSLKELLLEWHYRDKAGGYFGVLLRKLKVIAPHTLEDILQANLSRDEFREVLLLDVLVRGRLRDRSEQTEVWLAVEVSAKVNTNDVNRARRRAALLRKCGYAAIAVVAGEEYEEESTDMARSTHVVMLQNGSIEFWDEAVDALLQETLPR